MKLKIGGPPIIASHVGQTPAHAPADAAPAIVAPPSTPPSTPTAANVAAAAKLLSAQLSTLPQLDHAAKAALDDLAAALQTAGVTGAVSTQLSASLDALATAASVPPPVIDMGPVSVDPAAPVVSIAPAAPVERPVWTLAAGTPPEELPPWEAREPLFGNTGAWMADLVELDLALQPAFVLSAAAGQAVRAGERGVEAEQVAGLRDLEALTGRALGGATKPLFLTVLTDGEALRFVGCNDDSVRALAREVGNEAVAYESYALFVRAFATRVLGVADHHFEAAAEALQQSRSGPLTATDLAALVRQYKAIAEAAGGKAFPDSGVEQMHAAVAALANGPVIVQQQTAWPQHTCTSRSPATGEVGAFLPPGESLPPAILAKLDSRCRAADSHLGAIEVKFHVEDGEVHLREIAPLQGKTCIPTQTPGKLFLSSAPAALESQTLDTSPLAGDLQQEIERVTATLTAARERADAELKQLSDEGVHTIVSLLEHVPPGYESACQAQGMSLLRQPIVDFAVPDFYETKSTVEAIVKKLRAGDNVLVHCQGGLGRSGTVAACVMTALGMPPTEAVGHVRKHRMGAIETDAQLAFVHEYAFHTRHG